MQNSIYKIRLNYPFKLLNLIIDLFEKIRYLLLRNQYKHQNQIKTDCYTNRPKPFGNCQVIIEELEEHVEKEIEKIEHIHRETKMDYYYPDPGKNPSILNNNNNYMVYYSDNSNSKNLVGNERSIQVEFSDSNSKCNKIRVKNRRRSSSVGRIISNEKNS